MDIDRYAQWAARIPVGTPPLTNEVELLAYLSLGLTSEAGEIADLLKKRLRDGRWSADEATDELGDLAYYFARLCAAIGKTPSEILDRSVAKIESRLGQSGKAPPSSAG
jgi:NTP pyrophosphatase (non-canonical NTP hydrolase)